MSIRYLRTSLGHPMDIIVSGYPENLDAVREQIEIRIEIKPTFLCILKIIVGMDTYFIFPNL